MNDKKIYPEIQENQEAQPAPRPWLKPAFERLPLDEAESGAPLYPYSDAMNYAS